PQWTQARRIFSDSATSGLASCARVNLVCIANSSPITSHTGPHAAGIENALRIEPFAHALRQSRKRRRLGREHVGPWPNGGPGATGGGCADERGVSAGGRRGRVYQRRSRVIAARQSRPYEPAAPIVEDFRAGFVAERAADLRAAGWRRRNTPKIGAASGTFRRKRHHVADRAPQRPRRGFIKARERAERGEQIFQERFALRHRSRHAL